MADLEYHPKEKAVLADIAERLKVSPDILKFLEIENSEETSLFDSKLATLGLEEPVRQVDLDAAYARLSHRYEPSYFGKFSSVFEDLAKKYRAMIEDRYDQLSKNLESHLASKATIFDKPLADIISSDRIYRLIRGRGIRTIGELLKQPLEVVKNIDGLGASSWSKLENNLLNFSRRNSALLAAVESFLEQTPAHKAESPLDLSVRKLLSSRFMIESLEGAGMKTVRDILSTPHLSIRSLEGFDKQHWGELCRSLGDVGRTYSEAWPLIEDYFQGVLLHSGVNEVIAEPASELSEQEFQGVLSTVLEVVREKTSVPLWKIEDGLNDRGIVLAEEALAEALAAASRSGALFCLTKDRFGSPEALRIDSQRSEQLRDRALEYLAVHESINCFSSAWREGFTDLSADQVDFCLGMDTRFTRGEDEHYRLTQLEQSSPANKTDKELPSQEQQLAVQVKTLEDRVHERLENQGRFLRYEDLLEDTSLKDVVQALSENDRFLTAKCFRDYFGLSDWGIDEMTRAVNADWGILKLKLLRMTPGEAAELSELAAHSLISVCEQKELLKPLRVLNQKWSVACSDPTLANALKLLQESKKPTIITQLVRQIGLDRRDQANFIARAKEDVRFAVYPFASEKYIGLSDWGASAVGKVAEDCWPWVRMELKDATPEEGPDYTAEQWDAVRAVAEKMGEPELLPESQGLPPLEVDTSKTVTSPLEEEEEAESELYESTNETVAYIDRNDGIEILKDILSRANKQSKPFSIAELRVTEQEFKNLADWALELSPARVDSWVEDGSSFGHPKVSGWSWSEAFGFFLIVLWSEAARRRSVEGNLWKHIPGVFSEKTRRKIFAGNTPRAVAVDAFELAAKKAGVRHVFGLEGTQAIYITTFLQFCRR